MWEKPILEDQFNLSTLFEECTRWTHGLEYSTRGNLSQSDPSSSNVEKYSLKFNVGSQETEPEPQFIQYLFALTILTMSEITIIVYDNCVI